MENNTHNNHDKMNEILEKIKKNELVMRPKVFFNLKIAALAVLSVFAFIVSIFLFSFILFSLRASGHASLIGFGPSGLEVFLLLFPWPLFILELVLLGLVGWLLRSFRFGYKSPAIYVLSTVLLSVVISSVLVTRTTALHDRLLMRADHGDLPIVGKMYREVRMPLPPPEGHGIFRGEVGEIGTSSFTAKIDRVRGSSTVLYIVRTPDERFIKVISAGDKVFINGRIQDDVIYAERIKRVIALPAREDVLIERR